MVFMFLKGLSLFFGTYLEPVTQEVEQVVQQSKVTGSAQECRVV